jgi:hypothetical protein
MPDLVEIQLAARPGVSGRVTVYGVPVARAKVSLTARPENHDALAPADQQLCERLPATTDDDGRFTAEWPCSGDCTLRVYARGLVTHVQELDAVDAQRGLDGIEIALTEGASVEGTVLAEDGTPLVRQRVAALGPGGPWHAVDKTDAHGHYHIENLAPGRWQLRLIDRVPGTGADDDWQRMHFEIAAQPGRDVELRESEQAHVDLP